VKKRFEGKRALKERVGREVECLKALGYEPRHIVDFFQHYLDVVDEKIENSLGFTVGNSILILTTFVIGKEFDGRLSDTGHHDHWTAVEADWFFVISFAALIIGLLRKMRLATHFEPHKFSKPECAQDHFFEIIVEMEGLIKNRTWWLNILNFVDYLSIFAIITYAALKVQSNCFQPDGHCLAALHIPNLNELSSYLKSVVHNLVPKS